MLKNKNLGVVQKEVLTFDQESSLTLGPTRKSISLPWYKRDGGWMEPLPGVFDILQYFETILPLVESLWSS